MLKKKLQRIESKGQTKQDVQIQTNIQGFPSLIKMDEMSVHSPLDVKKFTVWNEDTASPVQMVTGKDLSNPFMAVTLSKSENE